MPEVNFIGPAGRLQGRFHQSKETRSAVAIIMHPHPQFGGNMNNQITYQCYYAFVHRGFSVLRFNFRGVGNSEGVFDHGVGEVEDALAALEFTQNYVPDPAATWVAGFSFGSWIGMQVMMRRPEVSGFISIAPPANLYDFSFLQPCPASGLFVNGDSDAVVPSTDVDSLVARLQKQRHIKIEHAVIPGANHFFDGKLTEMMNAVTGYLDSRVK